MALKTEENPYEALDDFPASYYWFYQREYEDIVFMLINEYARFKQLTQKVIGKIFTLTNLDLNNEIIRKRLPTMLHRYSKHSYETTLKILEYLIEIKKEYETAWYMQWLYIYLDIAYEGNDHQTPIYKKILTRFIDIQKKKKFVTFDKKYKKTLKQLELEDSSYNKGYEQKLFDF